MDFLFSRDPSELDALLAGPAATDAPAAAVSAVVLCWSPPPHLLRVVLLDCCLNFLRRACDRPC